MCLWLGWAPAHATDVEQVEVLAEDEAAARAAATTLDATDPRGSEGLAELLERAAGLTIRRQGALGSWAGVSIRGASAQQVQVFVDGVPLNPDGSYAVNLSELPLAALASVKIWRGVAPAAYGASPMGGVIDLQSPSDAERRPVFRMGYGALQTARASGSVAGAAKQAPLDGWLAVDAFHARNDFRYFSDNGTRYTTEDDTWRIRTNNDVQQVSVHGRLRVRHDGWTFGVLDALLLRHGGVAGPIGDPAEDTELDTWRNLATLWGHGGVGPVRVEARAWHLGRGDVLADPYDEVGVGYTLRRDRFDTGGTQLTLRGRAPGWLAWTGVLQARGESYVGTHLTTGDELGRAQRGVLGATVEARGTWHSDVFEAVLQADVRGVVGQAPSWSGVLPRAAFTWAPSTMWALRMSGGAGFRAPTLTELFGDRGAIVGNPDLRPERGQSVDLTVAWRAQPHPTVRLDVELGGFARWGRDRIVYVQNAQRSMIPVNFGRSRVLGAEGALQLDVSDVFSMASSVTLQDPRNLQDDPAVFGKFLPSTPRWQWDQRTEVGWHQLVRVGHSLHFTGETPYDALNWFLAPPRWIHGAYLRLQPWAVGPSLELEVANLTDNRATMVDIDPLQPDAGQTLAPLTDVVGYPLAGRTWMLTLVWKLDRRRS